MTNYAKGREFETSVHERLAILEQRGLLSIIGRNVKVQDKDGNEREIDILISLKGPFYSVDVCIECKTRERVKIETMDRVRSLRGTLNYNNFIIVSDGPVSQPTRIAANRDNVPVVGIGELDAIVAALERTDDKAVRMTDRVGIRLSRQKSEEQKVISEVGGCVPAEWCFSGALWPYLVTSRTELGLILLQWICEESHLEWQDVRVCVNRWLQG